ncbi:hypothetical protein ACT453_40585, partial [Bacillus sp. D-CC]
MCHENGTIGIDAGATGIEAVKGVKAKTMHDETAKDPSCYRVSTTCIRNNLIGNWIAHAVLFVRVTQQTNRARIKLLRGIL